MTNPMPKTAGPYSQLVKAGPFIFVAGQLPIDPHTKTLVTNDIRIQTRQVLENIKKLISLEGYQLNQIVRTDVFMANLEEFQQMNEEYAKYFSEGVLPVRQTIQAARLPMDALIEISCIIYGGN